MKTREEEERLMMKGKGGNLKRTKKRSEHYCTRRKKTKLMGNGPSSVSKNGPTEMGGRCAAR